MDHVFRKTLIIFWIASCSGFNLPSSWRDHFHVTPGKSKGSLVQLEVSRMNRDIFSRDAFGHDDGMSMIDTIHIHDILLQRAIQTEIYNFYEVHNEVKAKWLSGFMNHSHLDGGEWHSVVGLNIPMSDYLQYLLHEPIHQIEVKVRVRGPHESGPTDDISPTGLANDPAMANVHPDLLGWTKAASSRRRNPYLKAQEPKYFTYTEDIDPKFLAESLMTVTAQLGAEWRDDLSLQIEYDDPSKCQAEIDERRQAQKDNLKGDHSRAPVFEAAERYRSGSSPLRRQNFDILQRVSTILAVKSLETELAYESRKSVTARRSLHWVEKFYAPWCPKIYGMFKDTGKYAGGLNSLAQSSVCEAMLEAMEMNPPVFFEDAMIDPPSLAHRIRQHRRIVDKKLIKQLDDTDMILANVRRNSLERYMLENSFTCLDEQDCVVEEAL